MGFLDPRQVDIFAKKSPKRDLSIKKGPKDRYSRRFIVAIVIYRRIDILGEFEFIVAIVIWYEILYAVNLVSKHLQIKDMLIDIAIEKVEGLISFFKNYSLEALETAKGIALEMDIGTTFRKKRVIKRKRQFDETSDDTNLATQSAEESFRISYFIPIVDQAIASLTRRFEQYQSYQKNFGFLFLKH